MKELQPVADIGIVGGEGLSRWVALVALFLLGALSPCLIGEPSLAT